MSKHVLLSVLLFQEPHDPSVWIAQALEHDIAAYGSDIPSAKLAFARTVNGYFRYAERHQREPLEGVRPAPDMFWSIWRQLIESEQNPVAMERLEVQSAFMIPAVSHEPLSSAH